MKKLAALLICGWSLCMGDECCKAMFVPPGDALLQARSQEVALVGLQADAVKDVIEKMFIAANSQRGEGKRGLVGLAAPQIGEMHRIILVDVGISRDRKEFGELKLYINPEIMWSSDEIEIDREGCFSVDPRVYGMVPRAKKIVLHAFDQDGSKQLPPKGGSF
jgi:peptide deformylase